MTAKPGLFKECRVAILLYASATRDRYVNVVLIGSQCKQKLEIVHSISRSCRNQNIVEHFVSNSDHDLVSLRVQVDIAAAYRRADGGRGCVDCEIQLDDGCEYTVLL